MESRESLGDPRVALAVERTFLAWVRTGIAMMGFGFLVARFAVFLNELATEDSRVAMTSTFTPSVWIGIMLVAAGIAVQIGATYRYRNHLRLLAGTARSEFLRPTFGVVIATVLAAIGTVTMIVLIVRLWQ